MIKLPNFSALITLFSYKRTWAVLLIVVLFLALPQPAAAVEFGCDWGHFAPGGQAPDLGCLFGEMILDVASIFAFIAGNILDLVVKLFVFEMSTTLESGSLFTSTLKDPATGTVIQGVPIYRQMWFVVRDLANLSFIFILIYASLATIFNIKSRVDIKRVIPQLVLVAVIMNFSLFFVQVAVDFSNYISYEFFTAVQIRIDDNPEEEGDEIYVNIGEGQDVGLSDVIMNVTRITSLVANQANTGIEVTNEKQPTFSFGLFAGIFVFVAGLVMLAGAFLLFIRFFMLLIYMVASPIAFAASIIEGGKDGGKGGIFKGWWLKGLSNQLMFAPLYFGLMYLALQFLGTISADAGLQANDEGMLALWVRTALIFILASAFLIYAIYAAKSMSIAGADKALNFVKKYTGNYGMKPLQASGRGVKALGGAAGRNTVGRAGEWGGTRIQNLGNRLRTSDNSVLRFTGNRIGRTGTALREKSEGAKFGSKHSLKSKRDQNRAETKKLDTQRLERLRETTIRDIENLPPGNVPTPDQLRQLERSVSNTPQSDLEDMVRSREGINQYVAGVISSGKFKKMMEDENLTPEQKDELREQRFRGMVVDVPNPAQPGQTIPLTVEQVLRGGNNQQVRSLLSSLTPDDLAELSRDEDLHLQLPNNGGEVNAVVRYAGLLQQQTLDSLRKVMDSAEFSEVISQRLTSIASQNIRPGGPTIREAIDNGMNSQNTNQLNDLATALKMMSARELELEQGILDANEQMVALLSDKAFSDLQNSNNLSPDVKSSIARNRRAGLEIIAQNNPEVIMNMKFNEVAKMPGAVLTEPEIMRRMTPPLLNTIAKEGSISANDRQTIRGFITNNPNATPQTQESAAWLNGPGVHIF